jgi:ATP-binding cassette, subfamily F, member 3
MISAVNIALQYGGRYLFEECSFRIGPHDRIGLVGSNGAGKSTLLKVLVGDASPESGQIEKAKYVNVGYLPQDGIHAEGNTVYSEVESVFGNILDLQSDLDAIHLRMSTTDHESEEFQELLEIYGELQHKLEDSEAFRLKAKIEKILMGLGFSQSDMTRQTQEFSGGWQMRIALAKLLLLQPSLLLLDEPTNHLDLDSLQWLEEYLRTYEGAVMIVSHDRRFLDTMTSKTFELSQGTLTDFAGNYSFYVTAKEERKQLQLSAFKNQQQQIKQTERFIERFRYKATKARQVQSRIKQLDKIDLIEIEDEEGSIHFHFSPAPQSGKVVMELRQIHKSYGSIRLFSGIDFQIDRGDRIAFVGVNGAGKSTLSRIIAGVESFERGERKVGHNVSITYFAQHQAEELDPEHDVLETVDAVATGEHRKRLRTILGSFLFSGDDVFKKVRVLSGGEKSRLALAKMLLQPSNFIVMDEPTNHLDMRSKGILQEALNKFDGSYVIVSHDRDFLDPIITKVIEFRNGSIKTYLGNVSEYLSAKARERADNPDVAPPGTPPSRVSEKDRKRLEAEHRQTLYKKTKPIVTQITELERSIEAKEKEKSAIELLLANPDSYHDGEQIKEATARYKLIQKELSDAYFKWGKLTQELEKVQNNLAPPA